MTCRRCSRSIEDDSAFCRFCGAAAVECPPLPRRRLFRSMDDRKIAGVCGGLAEYFNADPTLVRLLVAVLAIYPGAVVFGLLAYVLAWIIIPPAPTVPLQQQASSAA